MGKEYELEVRVVVGTGLPSGDPLYVEVELKGRTVKTRTVKAAPDGAKFAQCLYPGFFKVITVMLYHDCYWGIIL